MRVTFNPEMVQWQRNHRNHVLRARWYDKFPIRRLPSVASPMPIVWGQGDDMETPIGIPSKHSPETAFIVNYCHGDNVSRIVKRANARAHAYANRKLYGVGVSSFWYLTWIVIRALAIFFINLFGAVGGAIEETGAYIVNNRNALLAMAAITIATLFFTGVFDKQPTVGLNPIQVASVQAINQTQSQSVNSQVLTEIRNIGSQVEQIKNHVDLHSGQISALVDVTAKQGRLIAEQTKIIESQDDEINELQARLKKLQQRKRTKQ